ncbi:MAG: transcription antitermination factor NusB [Desulfatiglans sp.]|jgi:transcription antitermination factor NusB|nr:transcription antitermination factor NusB [Desulfatiglans sp.]
MGNRRKARELVTQILFFMEYSPGDPEKSFELICENFDAPKSLKAFSGELIRGISENLSHIDSLIKEASKNWRLERMSRVDRSILRLSIYEMLYMESIPYKVSIDEAVELGKRYGTEESGAFINGVLDYIYIKYLQDKNRK